MSALTWTPVTYYVAMGIIHTLIILLGFRAMQVDAENNTFIGALIAAGVIGVTGYFTRDFGVLGVMGFGVVGFGIIVAVTSGEALKSFIMFSVIIASFGIGGRFMVEPNTPLTLDQVNGMTRVVMTGGLEAEPMTEEDSDKLMDATNKEKKK
jgi:hypothetical protein